MKLHIDIETFSSVDIKSAGSYKYFESPDFEILILAYAFDDGPIQVADLTLGNGLPGEFADTFDNPEVTLCAHNANFERNAFKTIGFGSDISRWECSAVKAAYCGLPLSLEKVSEALELGEKGKKATGKALIRYFSIPCKPTKSNGMRTRNMPGHDLEKWEEYKTYCKYDVEAEREICRLLDQFKVPEEEKQMYVLDQQINDRGIMIDTDLADAAVSIDEIHGANLRNEIKKITGLDNPNSPAQLKEWIGSALNKEVKSLAKGEIPKLLEEAGTGPVSEVLKLRQKASKTSTKKYVAMQNCVCKDGRAHGLFQFYGANRTGRWAGRIVQLQNLRRNELNNLEQARDIIKTGDYGLVTMAYENVSDTLSQLIRTALIAKPGHTFAVADFSAIEARVIAWMAGENWRLDVFKTHGKIYEASASMMFGVPIEEVTKDSDFRAKGKVAELGLGYGGAVGALKTMGGEKMGLSETEMEGIVKRWRAKNPAIVRLWGKLEKYAKAAVHNKKTYKLHIGYTSFIFDCTKGPLQIQLPSGRRLFYWDPKIGENRFGGSCVTYMGMNQTTKKWERIDTYGGKLAENLTQAVARDLLTFSMVNAEKNGYPIVLHVHDEIAAEIPFDISAVERLSEMCEIMSRNPDWATGLPLAADGYITNFYKKD